MALACLEELVRQEPRSKQALAKDILALLQRAPENSNNMAFLHGKLVKTLQPLAELAASLKQFLRYRVLPDVRKYLRKAPAIHTTYAGGATKKPASCATPAADDAESYLNIATFNPGRVGLLSLSGQQILWWRLEHIGATLLHHSIHIAALPAARIPPGTSLPDGFPFMIIGHFSDRWDSSCFMVARDIQDQVVELEYDSKSMREHWIRVPPRKDQGRGVVLASIYPALGGGLCVVGIHAEEPP